MLQYFAGDVEHCKLEILKQGTLAIIEDQDELLQIESIHQCLRCLLKKKTYFKDRNMLFGSNNM